MMVRGMDLASATDMADMADMADRTTVATTRAFILLIGVVLFGLCGGTWCAFLHWFLVAGK